jgi:transposase
VEGLGSLARFRLTGGEAGDSPEALPLLQHLNPGSVSADKAYDSDSIIEYLNASNIQAVIPPRCNRLVQRAFDKHLYRNRNLVERFFCRIKQFRRIATRYDKLAQRFASFVAFTAAIIWLA